MYVPSYNCKNYYNYKQTEFFFIQIKKRELKKKKIENKVDRLRKCFEKNSCSLSKDGNQVRDSEVKRNLFTARGARFSYVTAYELLLYLVSIGRPRGGTT